MFAGLKLGRATKRGPDRPAEADIDQAAEPRGIPTIQAPIREERRTAPEAVQVSKSLEAAVGVYVQAFADAERMRAAKLPVLPHQALALTRAGEGLHKVDLGMGRDLRAALERAPGLAAGAGTREGWAALQGVVAQERAARLDPTVRAERYVARWNGLETAYAAAGRVEQEKVKDRMRGLAAEIKRDSGAEGMMKARTKELGIASGSRLARVIEATSEREAERATRSPDRGLSR